MPLIINSRYKRIITVLVWLLAVTSTIASFFILPIIIAAPVSVASLLLAIFANLVIYRYCVVAIHPPIADDFDHHWIGSLWGIEDETDEPFFGLLYETQEAAKSAFQSLRTYTSGKYIDSSGEIQFRVVKETENKFSTFVYPKRGGSRIKSVQSRIQSQLPSNSKLEIREYNPFVQISTDHSNDASTKKLLNELNANKKLFINAFYVKDDKPVVYSAKNIQLTNFRLVSREDLTPEDVEYCFKWYDAKKTMPIQYNRAKSIERICKANVSNLTKTEGDA